MIILNFKTWNIIWWKRAWTKYVH